MYYIMRENEDLKGWTIIGIEFTKSEAFFLRDTQPKSVRMVMVVEEVK